MKVDPFSGYLFVRNSNKKELPRQVVTQLSKGQPLDGVMSFDLVFLQRGSP